MRGRFASVCTEHVSAGLVDRSTVEQPERLQIRRSGFAAGFFALPYVLVVALMVKG